MKYLLGIAALLCLFLAARGQEGDGNGVKTIYDGPIRKSAEPPADTAVKVAEYVMVNGKKIAVAEWSNAKPVPQATPAPRRSAQPSGFPVYNPSHNCPACGSSQYVVAGWNADGTHNHQCPSCRTVWRH